MISPADYAKRAISNGVPVFIFDNIAEYVDLNFTDKELSGIEARRHVEKPDSDIGYEASEFPNCRPPFIEFFAEWQMPMRKSQNRWTIRPDKKKRLMGAHVVSREFEDGGKFTANLFVEEDGGYIAETCFCFDVTYNLHGNIYVRSLQVPDLLRSMAPLLLGISFLNCKRVDSIDVSDSDGPSRKWLRRQKKPSIKYHVLKVNPLRIRKRTTYKEEVEFLNAQAANPRFIVRGHFATYTKERPLFGKYWGTFWREGHKRGDVKNGMVLKDYEVISPEGALANA